MGKKKKKREPKESTPLEEKLREEVEATGESINHIAKAAGVAQPILQRFMARKRDMLLNSAGRLAGYLGLELNKRKPKK